MKITINPTRTITVTKDRSTKRVKNVITLTDIQSGKEYVIRV